MSKCAGLVIKVTSFLVPGEWMWIDNSVVDYTNWKTGMPKSDSCVDINSDSGQWGTTSCSRYRSYICKTAKGKLNQLLFGFKSTHQSLTLSIFIFFPVITPTEKPPSVGKLFYLAFILNMMFQIRVMSLLILLVVLPPQPMSLKKLLTGLLASLWL